MLSPRRQVSRSRFLIPLLSDWLTVANKIVKKFNLFVYMVKKHSVEELTKRIKSRNVITRHSVLNESEPLPSLLLIHD